MNCVFNDLHEPTVHNVLRMSLEEGELIMLLLVWDHGTRSLGFPTGQAGAVCGMAHVTSHQQLTVRYSMRFSIVVHFEISRRVMLPMRVVGIILKQILVPLR